MILGAEGWALTGHALDSWSNLDRLPVVPVVQDGAGVRVVPVCGPIPAQVQGCPQGWYPAGALLHTLIPEKALRSCRRTPFQLLSVLLHVTAMHLCLHATRSSFRPHAQMAIMMCLLMDVMFVDCAEPQHHQLCGRVWDSE